MTATDAHISIVAHITDDELRRRLGKEEIANGLVNWLLLVAARRSKYLPNGGDSPPEHLSEFATRLAAARAYCLDRPVRLVRDGETQSLWDGWYRELADGATGMLGAVTSRGAAQVMRFAVT
jgi:hypothetical protein